MQFDLEKHLREARIVACIALIGVLIYQFATLPNVAGRYVSDKVERVSARVSPVLDKVTSTITNVNTATNTAKDFVDEVSKDYYDPANDDQGLYWDIRNMIDRSSESSFATSRLITRLDNRLNGGADPETGVFVIGVLPAAASMLQALDATAAEARVSLISGEKALQPLQTALEHISRISAELEAELAKGGNVDLTFAELAKSVGDFDKLVDNEDIRKVLANTAATSKSLSGSAETLDIVMRPWRKKANQLKTILEKLAGMLKFVIPVPF